MTWRASRCRLLLAGMLAIACVPGDALAHAVLAESRPADGASLAAPPERIVLRFNEPVSPMAVRLMDQDGREVPGLAVETHGGTVIMRPPQPLPAGGYFVSYRVTSLDAHAVGATLRFGVGVPAPGAAGSAEPDRALASLNAAARWLLYLTVLGVLGAALFIATVRPPEPVAAAVHRLAARLTALALLALTFRLGVAGLDLAGLPLRALFTLRPWIIASKTSLGPAIALVGLGVAVIGDGRRLPAWMLGLGTLAIAGGFGLTGHMAAAEPRWLTGTALALHVLAVAFWMGSLLPLFWSLKLPHAAAALVLRRFSQVATVAVAMLLVAGIVLAWVQLDGDAANLWQTEYGRRLLAKLALVTGLLILALINRLALAPAVARGNARATRLLRLSLGVDLVLGAAVLAVTATFPLSPPPRALAARSEGITIVASGRQGQTTLTLVPGVVGANRVEASVVDRAGLPLTAREATLAWSLPTAGIEPVRVAAAMPAPGAIVADGILLPRPGRWRLRLDLLIDDFTKLTYESEFDVR